MVTCLHERTHNNTMCAVFPPIPDADCLEPKHDSAASNRLVVLRLTTNRFSNRCERVCNIVDRRRPTRSFSMSSQFECLREGVSVHLRATVVYHTKPLMRMQNVWRILNGATKCAPSRIRSGDVHTFEALGRYVLQWGYAPRQDTLPAQYATSS